MSSRGPYLRSGIAALVVLVLIGIGVSLLTLSSGGSHRRLSGAEVASALIPAIQAQRRTTSTPDVRCPPVTLRKGDRFSCTLVEHPHPVVVEVTQIDGRGDFRVEVTDRAPAAVGTSIRSAAGSAPSPFPGRPALGS